MAPRIQRNDAGKPIRVWISAQSGAGIDLLNNVITELLADGLVNENIVLQPGQAKLRSQLYENNFVTAETMDEEGRYLIDLRLPRAELDRLLTQKSILLGEQARPAEGPKSWSEKITESSLPAANSA
jgi:GTP-binding protein HflX